MRPRGIVEFTVGLVLQRLLGSEKRRPAGRSRVRPRPAKRSAAPPPPAPAAPAGRPQGPLVGLMLGAFAVGALLMLVFEAWYTRLAGVTALFTFIVAGVFAIAGRNGLIAVDDE